jgi:hypothetical protein
MIAVLPLGDMTCHAPERKEIVGSEQQNAVFPGEAPACIYFFFNMID